MIRLQKYLAECGVASRRAAEKLIADGEVQVDNRTVTQLGTKINPDRQHVVCRGRPVQRQEKIRLIVNKPVGVICTSDDPQGRERVLDLIPDVPGRVYTVGRLDVMSEGLILVTNDGELAHRLMHPRYHIEKKYQVWIDQPLSPADMQRLMQGVNCRGESLKALQIRPARDWKGHCGYTLTLGEGRNRQIRRMMEAVNRKVIRLVRVAIGPLRLETLRCGEYRPVSPSELKKLSAAVRLD